MLRHALADRQVGLARLSSRSRRQIFQAEKSADAVLEVDDEVAFLQFGEINVERGTGGERVRRFQPARTLDFVAAKNLRVGDDDEFGVVAKETAGKRADLRLGSEVRGLGLRAGGVFSWNRDARPRTRFFPNFLKPLPFAVVVAKDVDGVTLPQPAVKLAEKFAALGLGNWQFRRAFGQRTVKRRVMKITERPSPRSRRGEGGLRAG